MSATQRRFGSSTESFRSTRSGDFFASASRMVVVQNRRRLTPTSEATRISRATRLWPPWTPSAAKKWTRRRRRKRRPRRRTRDNSGPPATSQGAQGEQIDHGGSVRFDPEDDRRHDGRGGRGSRRPDRDHHRARGALERRIAGGPEGRPRRARRRRRQGSAPRDRASSPECRGGSLPSAASSAPPHEFQQWRETRSLRNVRATLARKGRSTQQGSYFSAVDASSRSISSRS